jgi:hypothetical protein
MRLPLPPVAASAPTHAAGDDEATQADTAFVLAIQTTGFFSSLDNGVFVGGRTETGAIWGVGGSFSADRLSGNFAPSTSGSWGISIYPGAKLVLARAAHGRVDLVGDLDLGFTKYYVSDHTASSVSDGYGVWANVGPGLRFWMTPSLAISYSALLDVIWRTGRKSQVPGEVVSPVVVDGQASRQSTEFAVNTFGRLTLLGVF